MSGELRVREMNVSPVFGVVLLREELEKGVRWGFEKRDEAQGMSLNWAIVSGVGGQGGFLSFDFEVIMTWSKV